MQIQRHSLLYLEDWCKRKDRKPMILRGARQVGKTTLVNEFAKQFDVFLTLNLDKKNDKEIFNTYDEIEYLTDAIYRHCRKVKTGGRTLLFIDEIQNSSKAVAKLRYFYEEKPDLYVIAAGSLLESLIDKSISFPVGRVEYMVIRPCSFLEFLNGIGDIFEAKLIENLEADAVHDRIMYNFNNFCIVGGMPSAIVQYSVRKDVLSTDRVYESIFNSYVDDVQKYARNETITKVINFILKNGFSFAAERITFERFAASNYKSREVGEAFRTIEKAMLLELVFPSHSTQLPLIKSYNKKPKLFWLDTGLVNYIAQVRDLIFSVNDISDVWRGRIAEHIVAQELLSSKWQFSSQRQFWERNSKNSMAEVDFLYQSKDKVIPIEVKSGHNSHLKSLHLFMDEISHEFAIRIWKNKFSIDEVCTQKGKKFKLLNVPFYYVCVLDKIIEEFCQ